MLQCDELPENYEISDDYGDHSERDAAERNMGRGGNGAQGRDRTTDTVIFSHVLYQLSYLGTGAAARENGVRPRATDRL